MQRETNLTVTEQEQLKIAKATLRKPDAIAAVMGGMSKADAIVIITTLTAKEKRQ